MAGDESAEKNAEDGATCRIPYQTVKRLTNQEPRPVSLRKRIDQTSKRPKNLVANLEADELSARRLRIYPFVANVAHQAFADIVEKRHQLVLLSLCD